MTGEDMMEGLVEKVPLWGGMGGGIVSTGSVSSA